MTRDLLLSSRPTAAHLFNMELQQTKVNWPLRLSPMEIARKVAQAWLELSPAERQLYRV
jgi:hypothetical protein